MSRIVIACPNLSLDRTIAVERIEVGHVHRARNADVRGGGKGANVARALRCVGISSVVVGFTGGRTGDAVAGLLCDEGIEAHLAAVEGETRSCVTVVAPGGVTVFNEPGSRLDQQEWESFAALVEAELADAELFVCSGSWPPGAPSDGAARLLRAARRLDTTTICDTSGAQLAPALRAGPDLVAPNLAEARALLGEQATEPVETGAEQAALARAAEAARALVERGARATVVTAGSAGAALAIPAATTRWRGVRVATLNPVGAGDCLVAGVVAGLADGDRLEGATRRGMAMAAASCETFAAGELVPQRYEELLAQVEDGETS